MQVQIKLEVIENKTVLTKVVECIQPSQISIHSFVAEEKNGREEITIIVVETNKEQLRKLLKELTSLTDAQFVEDQYQPLPSSELRDIYEE